jgi:hypothetical protein
VFTPGHFRSVEARSDLEGLCRWDGQHGVAKLGFELVKYRLAKPGGNVANDASYDSSDRVLGILGSNDALRSHNYPENRFRKPGGPPWSYVRMSRHEDNELGICLPPPVSRSRAMYGTLATAHRRFRHYPRSRL